MTKVRENKHQFFSKSKEIHKVYLLYYVYKTRMGGERSENMD